MFLCFSQFFLRCSQLFLRFCSFSPRFPWPKLRKSRPWPKNTCFLSKNSSVSDRFRENSYRKSHLKIWRTKVPTFNLQGPGDQRSLPLISIFVVAIFYKNLPKTCPVAFQWPVIGQLLMFAQASLEFQSLAFLRDVINPMNRFKKKEK